MTSKDSIRLQLKPRRIVCKYFNVLFIYVFVSLMLSVCVLFISFSSDNEFVREYSVLFSSGLFLCLCLAKFHLIVYFFRVLSERKTEEYTCRTIVIETIAEAKHHNFYTRGGLVGFEKSVLKDTEGRIYYYIGHSITSRFLLGEAVTIECLPKTGFLLSIGYKNSASRKDLTWAFNCCFSFYLSN